MLSDDIKRVVNESLTEDLGGTLDPSRDITAALIPADEISEATVITREPGIFCGEECVPAVFKTLCPDVECVMHVHDGDRVEPNELLFTVRGPSRALLTGERTCLNIIQTLSGVATHVNAYVKAMGDTSCRLLDTRKTIPGLRTLLKYAVTAGGGHNHRMGLFDAYLSRRTTSWPAEASPLP